MNKLRIINVKYHFQLTALNDVNFQFSNELIIFISIMTSVVRKGLPVPREGRRERYDMEFHLKPFSNKVTLFVN